MLFNEIIATYSESHTKCINIFCLEKYAIFYVKEVEYMQRAICVKLLIILKLLNLQSRRTSCD
jgi:hypothetical protein